MQQEKKHVTNRTNGDALDHEHARLHACRRSAKQRKLPTGNALARLNALLGETLHCQLENGVCVVDMSEGGTLSTFQAVERKIMRYRIRIVIDGPCLSSCAIVADDLRRTGLVSVTDRALFGFHSGRLDSPIRFGGITAKRRGRTRYQNPWGLWEQPDEEIIDAGTKIELHPQYHYSSPLQKWINEQRTHAHKDAAYLVRIWRGPKTQNPEDLARYDDTMEEWRNGYRTGEPDYGMLYMDAETAKRFWPSL